jgi:hypothetical protein
MATVKTVNGVPNISSIIGGLNIGSDHDLRPMKTGKASGWGMEYSWIEIARTEGTALDINEQAQAWCRERFGNSASRWFEKKDKFYFKNEKDLTLFILKWS